MSNKKKRPRIMKTMTVAELIGKGTTETKHRRPKDVKQRKRFK